MRLFAGLCLVLTLVCISLFLGVPSVHAAATTRLTSHIANSSCPPAGSLCDFQDPNTTGCARSAYQLGAVSTKEDTYHARIFWSRNCSANYAYVVSPDGSPLLWVKIERSLKSNVNCNQITCSWDYYNSQISCEIGSGPCAGYDTQRDPNFIPLTATTWLTNMLYSPTQQFRVEAMTVNSTYFSSYWH